MGSKLKLEKRMRNLEYAKKFKKKKKRVGRSMASSAGTPPTGTEVICAGCGVQTHVPFQPTNGKPVYCRPCFNLMRPTVTSVTMAPADRAPIAT